MYIIDFDEYLFEAKTSGYAKLRSLGFTIRIRCCCSKYESIKGIKKLRLEVYNMWTLNYCELGKEGG